MILCCQVVSVLLGNYGIRYMFPFGSVRSARAQPPCAGNWHSNSWTFVVQHGRAIKPDDLSFQNCFNGRQLRLPSSRIKFKPYNTPMCWWAQTWYGTIRIFSKQREKRCDFFQLYKTKVQISVTNQICPRWDTNPSCCQYYPPAKFKKLLCILTLSQNFF